MKFQVDFGVAKVTVWCGRGEMSAALAGPLELKLRELCIAFYHYSARPATSDEVRRILRATPSAAGPLAAGDQLTVESIACLIDGLDWIGLD